MSKRTYISRILVHFDKNKEKGDKITPCVDTDFPIRGRFSNIWRSTLFGNLLLLILKEYTDGIEYMDAPLGYKMPALFALDFINQGTNEIIIPALERYREDPNNFGIDIDKLFEIIKNLSKKYQIPKRGIPKKDLIEFRNDKNKKGEN